MTYTLGTVEGRGIRSVNYIYTEYGVTLTVTLTDDTTTEFTIPKGDKGDTGDTGVSITGVELVSRTGLTDLYVIRFSDGTSTNFSVTNGRDAVVDSSMDSGSTNALENRVITNELVGIHSDLDTKFNERDILQLLYDYGHVSDGTVSRITLVSDKDILSYAEGDVATLTATVYDNSDNPVSNQIVVFYKNGKVLDTGVTDANGEATYEYESAGVGDIVFGASIGSLFIETYSIEDTVLWKPDVSTIPVTSKSISINGAIESRLCLDNPIDLPSSFVITGTVKRVGSYAQQVMIGCGVDKDNMYEFPVLKSNGNMTFRNNINNISPIDEYAFETNTDVPFSYTYDGNGNHTLCVNNVSRTVTSSAISMDKFISLQLNSNGRLSNLKIKPL